MTKGARSGFTLVEVMLSGAIVAFMALALLEGLIVSAKISHENSELLAADAFAWDTAWKWLNKAYDDLPSQGAGVTYDSSTDAALAMTSNDCPVLARSNTGGDPRLIVRVTLQSDASGIRRHGLTVSAKRIDVDVEWGPADDRKCLNGLRRAGIASYGHPVTVFKSPLDRGMLE